MPNSTLLLTVEHGGNNVPQEYENLFKGYSSLLQSHRGLDIGTWQLAESISKGSLIKEKFFGTEITRLLVDVNRSLWRRTVFSEVTKPLLKAEKERILEKYYYAYRYPIYDFVKQELINGHKIIHIAIHSFTPKLNGQVRNADIGLLYNPERINEKNFCKEFKRTIKSNPLQWRTRFNYPYRGKPDGLTAHFRKTHPDKKYLGIEFEVNQKHAKKTGQFPKEIQNFLLETLSETIRNFHWI